MFPRKLWSAFCIFNLFILVVTGCSTGASNEASVEPLTVYEPKQEVDLITKIRNTRDTSKKLSELYEEMTLIDIHNHGADSPSAVYEFTQNGVDRIVLFGSVSEPSAKISDILTWDHYRRDPTQVYPSFAGFPIYEEEEGLSIVKEKLEQGYLNIGEVVAASTYSPVVSQVEWKAQHPNDGNLPQIYDLAAKYHVPVLLHIDPTSGTPIDQLEKALKEHPDTTIIFGHVNAYNTLENIKYLLDRYPNLYMDFFAGFTVYNSDSNYSLKDFIPLLEQYPDRFMLSTDTGYGLMPGQATDALYETIDLLSPETAQKVAFLNYERMIELQQPTDTQIAKIKELTSQLGNTQTYTLNKRMANTLIFDLERQVKKLK
ncbi:amidohydrolase [Paenibacillus glacialis]|uniref:Amidohydrolase n=2 Tax=Paenibacillus glacialis TaxID=494026 RepID=A0A168ELW6_9BACL|nr:amidohydrolase [Paenibacillus glacialis]